MSKTTYTILITPNQDNGYDVSIPEYALRGSATTPELAALEGDRLVAAMFYEQDIQALQTEKKTETSTTSAKRASA
jgi:hypothetical protein